MTFVSALNMTVDRWRCELVWIRYTCRRHLLNWLDLTIVVLVVRFVHDISTKTYKPHANFESFIPHCLKFLTIILHEEPIILKNNSKKPTIFSLVKMIQLAFCDNLNGNLPNSKHSFVVLVIGLKLFALISAQQYLRDRDSTTAQSTKSIHRSNEFEMLVDFFFYFVLPYLERHFSILMNNSEFLETGLTRHTFFVGVLVHNHITNRQAIHPPWCGWFQKIKDKEPNSVRV